MFLLLYQIKKEMKLPMNKPYSQYIKEVKALFPIMGREEKSYIKKLELSIKECAEECHCNSVHDLYKEFGRPADVLSSYLSSLDNNYLSYQLKKKFYIRYSFYAFLLLVFLSLGAYSYHTYLDHQVCKDNQIFFEETTIK